MCLAVPGIILECGGEEAVVDLQGSSLKISTILTPEVKVGDWVLIHAGYAITQIDETDALETWEYLREVYGGSPNGAIASDSQDALAGDGP